MRLSQGDTIVINNIRYTVSKQDKHMVLLTFLIKKDNMFKSLWVDLTKLRIGGIL